MANHQRQEAMLQLRRACTPGFRLPQYSCMQTMRNKTPHVAVPGEGQGEGRGVDVKATFRCHLSSGGGPSERREMSSIYRHRSWKPIRIIFLGISN